MKETVIADEVAIDLVDTILENNANIHNAIKELPPVEAVPVVHGEWLHRSYGFVICSECGNIIERLRRTDFCSNCGADMRKKV